MATRLMLLGNTDIIVKGDWCRPLYLSTMNGGHSDDYSFKSQYSGAPQNNTKWCRVERIMPFWIGTTVGVYNKKMEEFNEWEFVRGKLPSSHIHEDAEAPNYKAANYRDREEDEY